MYKLLDSTIDRIFEELKNIIIIIKLFYYKATTAVVELSKGEVGG